MAEAHDAYTGIIRGCRGLSCRGSVSAFGSWPSGGRRRWRVATVSTDGIVSGNSADASGRYSLRRRIGTEMQDRFQLIAFICLHFCLFLHWSLPCDFNSQPNSRISFGSFFFSPLACGIFVSCHSAGSAPPSFYSYDRIHTAQSTEQGFESLVFEGETSVGEREKNSPASSKGLDSAMSRVEFVSEIFPHRLSREGNDREAREFEVSENSEVEAGEKQSGVLIRDFPAFPNSEGENKLKIDHPEYRSLQDLYEFLEKSLPRQCWSRARYNVTRVPRMNGIAGENPLHAILSIDIEDATFPVNTDLPRIAILAGEHARELVPVELAVSFVSMLCGKLGELEKAKKLLEGASFMVILVANPIGRSKVEEGHYCVRGNENDVDLNRNWGSNTRSSERSGKSLPGKAPFSESETRIVRDLLLRTPRPKAFLTLHSGLRGVYTPRADSASPLSEDGVVEQRLSQLAKRISKENCGGCESGGMGYLRRTAFKGTCLDWVFDELNPNRKTLAMAFEVYQDSAGKENFSETEKGGTAEPSGGGQARQSASETGVGDEAVSRGGGNHEISRLQKKKVSCFAYFNPIGEKNLRDTVTTWLGAIATFVEEAKN